MQQMFANQNVPLSVVRHILCRKYWGYRSCRWLRNQCRVKQAECAATKLELCSREKLSGTIFGPCTMFRDDARKRFPQCRRQKHSPRSFSQPGTFVLPTFYPSLLISPLHRITNESLRLVPSLQRHLPVPLAEKGRG